MNIWEQIKSGALTDPKTVSGAILYALVFLFLAWLFGRASHLAVHRLFAKDTHNRVDRTAVKFLAQLARFAVYIFAFISYAHLVPALAGLAQPGWPARVSSRSLSGWQPKIHSAT